MLFQKPEIWPDVHWLTPVWSQDAEAVLDGISSKAEDVKESAHETASKVEQKSAQTADDLKAKAR